MTTQSDITDLLAGLQAALKEAFERGYRQGASDMRANILRAASGEFERVGRSVRDSLAQADGVTPENLPSENAASAVGGPPRGWPPDRVARGTVRRVLGQIMSRETGMIIAEITEKARSIDPNISATSIPNELRRNLGTLYRQEGSVWFLSDTSGKETTGIAINETPVVVSHHN